MSGWGPPPPFLVWCRALGPLTLGELRRRYAGSALGALWAVWGPLFEVAVYAILFGYWLRPATSTSGLQYALYVASGLLPWISLREGLEGSASLLGENRWIRRSRVPLALLVARQTLVTATRGLIGLGLVIVGAWALGLRPGPAGAILPVIGLALQAIAVFGLGLLLAPIGVLYPDFRHALTSALTLLTFASPIFYGEETLGPRLRALADFNPYAHLLRFYRAPLALGADRLAGADVACVVAATALALGFGLSLRARLFWPARDRL